MDDAVPLGALVLLALIDSASFGTLLIPIWLLMSPGRVRVGRLLTFLGTVVSAYFAIGVGILLGASAFLDAYGAALQTDAFLIAQLVLGAALVVISWLMDSKRARERAAERASPGGGRVATWRRRAMGEGPARAGTTIALMGLALAAVLAEVATMFPYLAAIGIITTQGPGWPGDLALLAGYCLVMIAPALILTLGRVVARATLERPLARIDDWLSRHSRSTTAWIIGIIGVILGLQALYELAWLTGG